MKTVVLEVADEMMWMFFRTMECGMSLLMEVRMFSIILKGLLFIIDAILNIIYYIIWEFLSKVKLDPVLAVAAEYMKICSNSTH